MTVTRRLKANKQKFALENLNKILDSSYTSLDEVPVSHIKKYMDISLPIEKLAKYEAYWDSLVADPQDIITDLHYSNYAHLFPKITDKKK